MLTLLLTPPWLATTQQMTPARVLNASWVVAGHTTPVTFAGLVKPVAETMSDGAERKEVVFAGSGGQRE